MLGERLARRAAARGAAAALAVAALLVAGPVAPVTAFEEPVQPDDSPFWVSPDSAARRQADSWRRRGREHDALLLRRIADHPGALWLDDRVPEEQVRRTTMAAALVRRVPVLVAYDIPHRDCGRYSAGGAPDAGAYRAWVRRVAAGVEDRRALVVLEPDAVAHSVSGCPGADPRVRFALLAEAVRTLKAGRGLRVYLDAGNSGWVTDAAAMAQALRAAGVARADGFALNVSNFQTTRSSQEYGDRLSAMLGGAHYVIDTSRNGRGPLPAGTRDGTAEAWCNPPGRALGPPPTTRTGDPLVDAYLWVKNPGESDGTCRGGPPAGQWWSGYALGLAEAAGDWPGVTPPAPTGPVTGFPGRR